MDLQGARRLLDRMRNRRILVVGDVMMDEYLTGTVERISPEAPVPVVRVRGRQYRPGGAANVALNVQALGGQARLAAIVGRDATAQKLAELLAARGVDASALTASDKVDTTIKTRVVAERQQVARIDCESDAVALQEALPPFCEKVAGCLDAAEGLIIEDYGKGLITQSLLDAVLPSARARGITVGFDPKDGCELRVSGITVATPNYREACLLARVPEAPLHDPVAGEKRLRAIGERLMAEWGLDHLMITLGPHGMYLMGRDEEPALIPTKAREVFDVSGAGDTVVATVVLALVSGATYREAALLANCAAGVVVGKLGTAVCEPEELLAFIGAL
jgi:D-glycero-beta-D-manno-heptose-7-phosphate kinase